MESEKVRATDGPLIMAAIHPDRKPKTSPITIVIGAMYTWYSAVSSAHVPCVMAGENAVATVIKLAHIVTLLTTRVWVQLAKLQ